MQRERRCGAGAGAGGNLEVAVHDLAQVQEADGGQYLAHNLKRLGVKTRARVGREGCRRAPDQP